jgi:hypothetical protein
MIYSFDRYSHNIPDSREYQQLIGIFLGFHLKFKIFIDESSLFEI